LINLSIKKNSEHAIMPEYHTSYDAGLDFFSSNDYILHPGDRAVISTGVSIQAKFDKGLMPLFEKEFKIALIIKDRSGIASKKGITISAGVIDEKYIGNIGIVMTNHSNKDFLINVGDKIAQGVFTLVPKVSQINIVNELEETERGSNGFGSSDLKV
jgi:dUTP pyrophosphatase